MKRTVWAWAAGVTLVAVLAVVVALSLDTDPRDAAATTSSVGSSASPMPETSTRATDGPIVETGPATSSASAPDTTTAASRAPATVAPATTTTTLRPSENPDAGEEPESAVPIGESIDFGGWTVGVADVDLDATDVIVDYVDFNEPPAEGLQYVLVELSGVNTSPGLAEPVFSWALVKPGFSHSPDGLECGVLPDSIYDVGELPPGAAFQAHVCFEVPTDEVTEDLVLTLGLYDASGQERFYSLR